MFLTLIDGTLSRAKDHIGQCMRGAVLIRDQRQYLATTSAGTNCRSELGKLLLPAPTPASLPRTPESNDLTLDTVPYDDRNLAIVLFLAVYLDQARNPNRAISQQSYPLPLCDDDATTITTHLINVLSSDNELDCTIRAYSPRRGEGFRIAPLVMGFGEVVRTILTDMIAGDVGPDTNWVLRSESLAVVDLHDDHRVARRVREFLDLTSRLVSCRSALQFGVSMVPAPVDCPVPAIPVVLVNAGGGDAQTVCRWANFVGDADAVAAARWFYPGLDHESSHIVDVNAPSIDAVPTDSREVDEVDPVAVRDQTVPPEPVLPAPLAELTASDGNLCIALFVAVYCDMHHNPMRPIYQHALSLPLSDSAVTDLTDALLDMLTTGFGIDRHLRSFAASSTPMHLQPVHGHELAKLAQDSPHRAPRVIEQIRAYLAIWAPAMLAWRDAVVAAGADRASSLPLPFPLQWAVGKPDAAAAAKFLFLVTLIHPHGVTLVNPFRVVLRVTLINSLRVTLTDSLGVVSSNLFAINSVGWDTNLCIALFAAAALDNQHQNPDTRPMNHDEFPVPLDATHVKSLADRLVMLPGPDLKSQITVFAKPEHATATRVLAVNGTHWKRRSVCKVLNELVQRAAGPAAVSKTPHTHAAVRDRTERYLTSWVPKLAENDSAAGFLIPAGVVEVDAIPSVLEVVVNDDGQPVMRWTDLAALDRSAAAAEFCHDLALGGDNHDNHNDHNDHDDDVASPPSRRAARILAWSAPPIPVPAEDLRLLASPWVLSNFAMLVCSAVADDRRRDPDLAIFCTSFRAATGDTVGDGANRHDLIAHLIQCCTASAAQLVLQAPLRRAAHADLDLAVNPVLKHGRPRQVVLDTLVDAYLAAALDAVRSGENWTTPAGQIAEAPVSFWAPDGIVPVGHKQMPLMGKAIRSVSTLTPAAEEDAARLVAAIRVPVAMRLLGRMLLGSSQIKRPPWTHSRRPIFPQVTQALADQCHTQLCAHTHVKAAANTESLVLVHDTTIYHLAQILAASLASQLATEFSTRVGVALPDRGAAAICHAARDVQQRLEDLAAQPATEPVVYLSDLYDSSEPWAQAMNAALDALWEKFRTVNVHRAPGLAVDLVRDVVLDMVVVCLTLARVGVRVEFPPLGVGVDPARMVKFGLSVFTDAAGNDDMDENSAKHPLSVAAAVARWLTRIDDGTHVVPRGAEVMYGKSSRSMPNTTQTLCPWATRPHEPPPMSPRSPPRPVEWTATIGSRAARTDSPTPTPARHRPTPVDRTPAPRPPTKRLALAQECADCGSTTEKGFKVNPETGRAQCRRCRQQERRARENYEAAASTEDVEMNEAASSAPLPFPVPTLACVACGTTESTWWRSAPRGGLMCTKCATGQKSGDGEDEEEGGGASMREDQDGPRGELLDKGDDDSDDEYVESTPPAAKRRRVSGAPRHQITINSATTTTTVTTPTTARRGQNGVGPPTWRNAAAAPPRPVPQLALFAPPLAAAATALVTVAPPPRHPVPLAFALTFAVAVSVIFTVTFTDAASRLARGTQPHALAVPPPLSPLQGRNE
ncbi:hypothetical protein AMAG_10052 [Allomyces macrogynus ATCC 38327]|uniref:GATA-type domain-containing protein n=1 Tax=Allomyces macrogynus (strain ATCC 38327) TaxID=578462 RepID=A0A0L0SQR5_ALLM3|nr:hypothetical protein AMAG_10052 [Allomyces macrogynus ATCC 38327]|eukprot:KNE64700.1 hypothetical protein AMAG_10052 [Allomyces macrogynus ATCC 38327]